MKRFLMVMAAVALIGGMAMAQTPTTVGAVQGAAVVQGDTEAVNASKTAVYLSSNHDYASSYNVQQLVSGTHVSFHAVGTYYTWGGGTYTAKQVDIDVEADTPSTVRFVLLDKATGAVLRDSGSFALTTGKVSIQ